MLTLFNRREVYVTQNMQKQAEVRDTLALAGINYTFKVSSGTGKPGGSLRGIGMGPAAMALMARDECSYTFYVHKKDYECAMEQLRRNHL